MALLIKNLNGLAYASVKSRNGLAVASIKSINGLDATAPSGITLVGRTTKFEAFTEPLTTNALNTVGANLIVIAITTFFNASGSSVSDSEGNTWTALTNASIAEAGLRLYYCASPTTDASHTFTISSGSPVMIDVIAVSGAHASPFDDESTNGHGGGTSIQPGSITPAENGSLIVCSLNNLAGGSPSVDSGFSTNLASQETSSLWSASSYIIQESSTAINPTWSWSSTAAAACAMAVFKPA